MLASAFPRVLFVTPAAFNHFTGGGVTFSNLFAGWPKDRIATVHNDAVPTSTDVCERYFVLGRSEIDLFAPLRIARTMRDRGGKSDSGAGVGPVTKPGLIARIQGDAAPQRARLSECARTVDRGVRAGVALYHPRQQCCHGIGWCDPPTVCVAARRSHDG